MKKALAAAISIVIIISASCTNEKVPQKMRFILETQKIIERFDVEGSSKELIEYQYDKPSDIYWKKAVYKDTSGNIFKTVERQFDINRFPISEAATDELGITEYTDVKYSPENYELIEKRTYYDENKKFPFTYNLYYYDKNGYLISQSVTRYSKDTSFKNVNGKNIIGEYILRYVPSVKNRPKGFNEAWYFTESSKIYCTDTLDSDTKEPKNIKLGDIEEESLTKFDSNGLPLYFKDTGPGCSNDAPSEWYKTDMDKSGRIMSITGYVNEKLDSSVEFNSKFVFLYAQNNLLSSVEEYKYNTKTGTYTRFHSAKSYGWISPGIRSPFSDYDCRFRDEYYCLHGKKYSVTDKKIRKYDSSEKVIENYSGEAFIENRDTSMQLQLLDRTTIKYKIINIMN
ncbi:MAG: hypothetical protein QG635_1613 [Bacteroidota bacterium]|nr:hypothetical protein [Bacteroidota bacterium]